MQKTFRHCAMGLVAVTCFFSSFWTLCPAAVDPKPQRSWNKDIVYFIMTDRFHDGDPENNVPSGSDPMLYDPTQSDLGRFHGGDLRGIEEAIENGYLTELGVTAIWLTPPVKNAWYSNPGSKTGYHGYWAQDFLDIDPHWISARRLSGGKYSRSRDGRMQHYKDFIDLAHRNNIKIIQDVVCNHIGPLFYYDVNNNDTLDPATDWFQPYRAMGQYNNAKWGDIPKWNIRKPGPLGPLDILGVHVKTTDIFGRFEVYGRKGCSADSLGKKTGEEITCDFYNLRDFWTDRKAEHFDALVDQFVELYYFYIGELGVDGLRIDTAKHVHHRFWDKFTERLRHRLGEKAKELILFGEVYVGKEAELHCGDPQSLGQWTFRTDYPDNKDPCLDSVLNFQFCYSVRNYLQKPQNGYGSARDLEQMIFDVRNGESPGRPYYNPTPGSDGLVARQKLINFVGNHDGLNRFRCRLVSEQNNGLALGLALLFEGIPCLYYGSEVDLEAPTDIGVDSESGRISLFRPNDATAYTFESARERRTFKIVSSLAGIRKDLPALTEGQIKSLWIDSPASPEDDGIFAFARYIEESGTIKTHETVIVVVNAHDKKVGSTGFEGNWMKLVSHSNQPLVSEDARLKRLRIAGQDAEGPSFSEVIEVVKPPGGDMPEVRIRVLPKTINVFVAEHRGG